MNKSLCILFLVISANVFAQNYNSLLYQVTKQNEDTSYIYGTIHLSKKDLLEVNKKLGSRIEEISGKDFLIINIKSEYLNWILFYNIPFKFIYLINLV